MHGLRLDFKVLKGLGFGEKPLAGGSRCKRCGTEVEVPVKSWTVKPKGKRNQPLYIQIYECPKCFYRWRVFKRLQAA
jgi:uncharacterized protein with PIN domain